MPDTLRPLPIRLVFDVERQQLLPIDLDTDLEDHWEEVELNAPSEYGGVRAWLYDTIEEAEAFTDAMEALIPHVLYATSAHPVRVGNQSCGLAITEIDWMGEQTLFRDKRRTPWTKTG